MVGEGEHFAEDEHAQVLEVVQFPMHEERIYYILIQTRFADISRDPLVIECFGGGQSHFEIGFEELADEVLRLG